MFLHALIQIIFITIGVLGITALLYWYAMQKGFLPTQNKAKHPSLHIDIESQQFLEPRKSLYIVRVGDKRFLLGSTDQHVSLISPLEDLSAEEVAAMEQSLQQQQQQFIAQTTPFTSFKEQFLYSVKMLTQERFGGR